MFDINKGFWGVISKMTDLIVLNILFLICCVPIVTIGASITALYGVTKKMTENKEGYMVRSFFKVFKENFKQSTIMWIILFGLLVIPIADLYIGNYFLDEISQAMFNSLMILTIVIVLFVMQFAFTLQSTFENAIKNTMKNALLMSIIHLPWTIIITILSISPFLTFAFLTKYLGIELLVMLLIWFSGVAYINSFIFNRIFRKYITEEAILEQK